MGKLLKSGNQQVISAVAILWMLVGALLVVAAQLLFFALF